MFLNCGVVEDSRESLGLQGDPTSPSILKEISPEYSLQGLKLTSQYFGHLMWRTDSLEKTLMLGKIEGKRRRGWQRIRCLDGITDSMVMGLKKLRDSVMDRESWHAVVYGVKSDWTDSDTESWGSIIFWTFYHPPYNIYSLLVFDLHNLWFPDCLIPSFLGTPSKTPDKGYGPDFKFGF